MITIEEAKEFRRVSSTANHDIYASNATLADWFAGEALPQIVPIGTATHPDPDGDEEQMEIIRSLAAYDVVEEAWELVDKEGCFCGILRRDSDGWVFVDPGIMA